MKMIKQINFNGELLRKAVATKRIIELNISTRECAKQIGISASTISRCENGKQIDFDSFAKLCLWLQQEPNDFFTIVRERQDGIKDQYFQNEK